MLPTHIALVFEFPGSDIRPLTRVSSALQKQMLRDVAPLWGVQATVDPFERLEDVPIDYWPIIVVNRDLAGQDGCHVDDHGKPYALIEASEDWSLAASHECIEMIIDPFGNRTVAGPSPMPDQGRVELLVEVCDPCQAVATAYYVNDVLVSDFVTPAYYEPTAAASAVRYSFGGKMTAPRSLQPGGYLSWLDPLTAHWWQRTMDASGVTTDEDLGPLEVTTRGHRSLREMINARTQHHRRSPRKVPAAEGKASHDRAGGSRRSASQRSARLRSHIRSLASLPATKPQSFAAITAASTGYFGPKPSIEELQRGIAALKKYPGELPGKAQVEQLLTAALSDWQTALARNAKDVELVHVESMAVSLVHTAISSPLVAPSKAILTGKDIIGFKQYEDLDPGWVATVWNHIFKSPAPFPAPLATPLPLLPRCTIAVVGDWGTGNESSQKIAKRIADLQPTYTIHLGDVYYSGTAEEEHARMLAYWPTGNVDSFALNSNHEMYSGGHGLLDVTLRDQKFETQGPTTSFALANDDWVILGLDSAYAATDFYQNGKLNQQQLEWLAGLTKAGVFTEPHAKKVIALSHHQGRDLNGELVDQLWGPLTGALGGGPDYWYWGHIHGAAVFRPFVTAQGRPVNARLVGHGGVPYVGDSPNEALLAWSETKNAGDGQIKSRSLNGFLLLTLDGANIQEEFIDENGVQRWQG